MFDMNYYIELGSYKLGLLQSVEIEKSVDLLTQTAVIVLPAAAYNRSLDREEYIKVGDSVLIKLGYNDQLMTEFEGYIQRIDIDDENLTINCEDSMYLTCKKINPKVFTKCKVKDIASYCAQALDFDLDCTIDIENHYFEKFTISPDDTVYSTLSKLKDATNGQIYITDNKKLNVHSPYSLKKGEVIYDFALNIEESDLKYSSENDHLFMVVVNGVGIDGKQIKVTEGKAGGDVENVEKNIPMSEEALQNVAKNRLDLKSYTGYEGSIKTWLVPFVEPTWSAKIIDKDYNYREGIYYVTGVKTTFDESGGVRTVDIGKRLASLDHSES